MVEWHDVRGERVEPKEDFTREDYLAKAIVEALGALFTARTNDLPHRYKVPPALAFYLADQDWGNEYYQQFQIGYGPAPVNVQIYYRKHKHVMEMQFQGPDGSNLMMLELDWSDIKEPREQPEKRFR
jgi:hypothetical protein